MQGHARPTLIRDGERIDLKLITYATPRKSVGWSDLLADRVISLSDDGLYVAVLIKTCPGHNKIPCVIDRERWLGLIACREIVHLEFGANRNPAGVKSLPENADPAAIRTR